MNANAMNHFQRLSVIALCSTSLGIGILRFAYTAIMPMTIDQHWWSIAFANDLANANLLGYLIGAIVAIKAIPENWVSRSLLISAVLGSFSLLGCGMIEMSELWYLFWRLISGVAGGILMVLGPSYSLKRVSPEKKYLLSLMAFSGIGLGVLLTTTLLPYLAHFGVAIVWFALAVIALCITLLLYLMLRAERDNAPTQTLKEASLSTLTRQQCFVVALVMLTYFISAIGYIPHSIYWVDFVVHQLGHDQHFANGLWMIYGVGSVFGAVTTYLCLKRWSSFQTLWRLYLLYAFAVFLPSYLSQTSVLVLSSLLTGLLNPATVSLTASLLSELVPVTLQRQIWGIAVVVFAIAQFSAGFVFAYLLQHDLPYPQIYLIAALTLAFAVVIALLLTKKHASSPQLSLGG